MARMHIRSALLFVLAAWLVVGGPTPSHAELRDLVTARRALGMAFIGGSAAMTLKGFDFHGEADDFYRGYKAAVDPVEIDKLYQRTTNRDVKAQVSWAMAAAFGISGFRLVLSGDGEPAAVPSSLSSSMEYGHRAAPVSRRGIASPPQTQLVLQPVPAEGKLALALHHRFF